MDKGSKNKGLSNNTKVAIGVAILLIGIGAYFLFKKKPKPKTIVPPIVDKEVVKKAYDNLLFATNRATILSSSFASLDELAKYVMDKTLKIVGHTDSVGDDNYNLELSKERADAVKKYLITKGVPTESITTDGLGETQPISDNQTSEGRAKNRRVELQIT